MDAPGGAKSFSVHPAPRPALDGSKVSPPSVLMKKPMPVVPAYTVPFFFGWNATPLQYQLPNPPPTVLQVDPPSVLLRRPCSVPAKSVSGSCGSISRLNSLSIPCRPRSSSVHESPPLSLLKSWPKPVAAYTVEGRSRGMASALMLRSGRPEPTGCHVFPPSELRRM